VVWTAHTHCHQIKRDFDPLECKKELGGNCCICHFKLGRQRDLPRVDQFGCIFGNVSQGQSKLLTVVEGDKDASFGNVFRQPGGSRSRTIIVPCLRIMRFQPRDTPLGSHHISTGHQGCRMDLVLSGGETHKHFVDAKAVLDDW
jgi:hypothetical protein